MKKLKFLIPAFALVALTFAGCSDDDGDDDQPVVTKLALTDPAQAALTFVATSPEAQVITLDTDASTVTVEQVLAEGEEKAEWCVVTVQSATQIKVAPASNTGDAERTVKYRISAGKLTPVEFTVTQLGIPKDELSIPAEYESGFIMGDGEYASYEIEITTTADSWMATLEPDEENPYAFMLGYGTDPVSGASGETLDITFTPNTTGMPITATVTITAGNATPIQLMLYQMPQSRTYATAVTVKNSDDVVLTSPYTLEFGAAEFGNDVRKVFSVEPDNGGDFEVKVLDGNQLIALDDYTGWVVAYAGYSWPIYPTSANTGAAREVTLVLVGENDAELFRMIVKQAGA